ncbi:MAG: hypothetical protein QOF21_610 [Actinomycetota bacterium]|jgi:hypothetical protein
MGNELPYSEGRQNAVVKRTLALTVEFLVLVVGLVALTLGAISADGESPAPTEETHAASAVAAPAVITTTTTAPLAAITLYEHGLSIASFGEAMPAVVDRLTARLGAPADQGKLTCNDGTEKVLSFRGLAVLFGRDAAKQLVFTGYGYSEDTDALGLVGDLGVHVGMRVAELRSIYGTRLQTGNNAFGPSFTIASEADVAPDHPFGGGLTNTTNAGTVLAMSAGANCVG